MANLCEIYAKILARVIIIIGIASLIATIVTKLLIFKIILGVNILFWVIAIIIYIYSEIEFKIEENKKGDD